VIGGVFGTRPDACYDGLHLTTSNVFMAFGDFPCKDDRIKHAPGALFALAPALATHHKT